MTRRQATRLSCAARCAIDIIDIADATGYFAEDGRYVDLKSYAVFSDGNRLFADNLERTLGLFGAARYSDGKYWLWRPLRNDALYPYYLRTHRGHGMVRGYYRTREIDRDFLIFDFILAMTVLLAPIGVANTLLSAVVGNILGGVSMSFLDHFTLFDYQIRLSWQATLVFSLVCFGTCLIAAIYPAFVAIRMSSAESLHYE